MTEIIRFIKENPDNWKMKLKRELNVFVKENEKYTLLIYARNADFNNPIVQECRGIILNKDHDIVCCPFFKFGNFYENYVPDIDWNTARVEEKLDGSIIKFWFDNDSWHISSNTSIEVKLPFTVDTSSFDKENTYIFELIGKSNHLKIPYIKDELVHIGTRNNKTLEEIDTKLPNFRCPRIFDLHSLAECTEYLEKTTEFIEGFVVVDKNWNRLKIKSERYLRSSIPSKKDIYMQILKDEPFDDYPEHFFDEERERVRKYIEKLPDHKGFKYRREPISEKEWMIKNIDKIIKWI